MSITLNHTIVPAHDKEAATRFFAQIFGLQYAGSAGHFAPVRVNEDLTLDFDNAESFEHHHYAFHVSDSEFDTILQRVQEARIPYGSEPRSPENRQLNAQRRPGVLLSRPERPCSRTSDASIALIYWRIWRAVGV